MSLTVFYLLSRLMLFCFPRKWASGHSVSRGRVQITTVISPTFVVSSSVKSYPLGVRLGFILLGQNLTEIKEVTCFVNLKNSRAGVTQVSIVVRDPFVSYVNLTPNTCIFEIVDTIALSVTAIVSSCVEHWKFIPRYQKSTNNLKWNMVICRFDLLSLPTTHKPTESSWHHHTNTATIHKPTGYIHVCIVVYNLIRVLQ